jgi:hypothetical protein
MTGVLNVCPKRASIALECFHKEIDRNIEANKQNGEYLAQRYRVFPYIGVEQPTSQSAELRDGLLELLRDWPTIVPEAKRGGDGTVPRASATPPELSEDYHETFFIQKHSALQNYGYALVDLVERLKQLQAPDPPDSR